MTDPVAIAQAAQSSDGIASAAASGSVTALAVFVALALKEVLIDAIKAWRESRRAARAGDPDPEGNGHARGQGYQSSASVVASNERITKHLHDIADSQRQTAEILRDVHREQKHAAERLDALHVRFDRLHDRT
jgi:hypothetical protein